MGGLIGALAGLGLSYMDRWNGLVGIIVGFLLGVLIAFVVITLAGEGAASLAGMILHPSGEATPGRPEYSYPQSLAARGHYEEAIAAYELCCAEHPQDPEPYLRIARLHRDELDMYDEALRWFKRARSEPALEPGQEILITREIVELYASRIGEPQQAIPELARLVDRFPDDPVSGWAKQEIARLRQEPEARAFSR